MAKQLLVAILTIVFGAFAGAFVWAFFFLMNSGIELLWSTIPNLLEDTGLPALFYPIAFCTIGGVVIGLFTHKFGDYPEDMNTVLAQVRKEGRYEYDHLGRSFVGALLPLLFGGSIGPEAGLTGVIAGLCTWVGDRLKLMGSNLRDLAEAGTAAVVSAIFATPLFGLVVPVVGAADDSTGTRPVSQIKLNIPSSTKLIVYILATAGALGSLLGLNALVGSSGGLPHFSTIIIGYHELLWGIPLALLGAVAGWLYFPFGMMANAIAQKLKGHPVLASTLAGIVLGAIGVVLPFALFAGEAQTEQLAKTWTTIGADVLIVTGFAKVFATQLCLNLGWRGGHFFPIIFAGISIGYGMAALTGIDPVFALCAVTGALVGTVMRQPIMTMLLLFLVFPVKGVFILLIAAVIGYALPVPRPWVEKS